VELQEHHCPIWGAPVDVERKLLPSARARASIVSLKDSVMGSARLALFMVRFGSLHDFPF
jgi:hypothetical protein